MTSDERPHGKTIGDRILSLRRSGGGRLRVLGELMKQLLREGRVGEVVVNLGREVIAPFRPGVNAVDSAYETTETGLRRHGSEGDHMERLPISIAGICRGGAEPGKVWAWHENSLLVGGDDLQQVTEVRRFENKITWLHETPGGNLIVAERGRLLVRVGATGVFRPALQLSHPNSSVRPRTAAVDATGRLFVGEYGNQRDRHGRWISVAWIHWSDDEGEHWHSSDVLVRRGVNKHIHVVVRDSTTGSMYASTGDSKKLVWSLDVQPGQPRPQLVVSRLTRWPWELGGYLSAESSDAALYWGTDYWMGTNFVVAEYPDGTSRRWMMGSTIRRAPVASMAILAGRDATYVLTASSNKQVHRQGGLSALLALNEDRGAWETVLVDKHRVGTVRIAQCGCDGISSSVHVKHGDLSYLVAERSEAWN